MTVHFLAVSGYRLVPRWLETRVGLPANLALVRELRDLCARIAELGSLFAEADAVLEETLAAALTRAVLDVWPRGPDTHDR